MNKVILTGRLTRDPDQRMSQNNLEISRFSLAAQSDYSSKTGERLVEFVNCVAFGKLAGTINRYCKKGNLVGIQGRIRNSSYDAQDGTKRYTTDVVIEQLEFLGSKNASQPGENTNTQDYQPNESNDIETTDVSEDPYKDFGDEITLNSDDLPF